MAFHVPPTTAFLMRLREPPAPTLGAQIELICATVTKRPAAVTLHFGGSGRAPGSPAALARGSFNGYFGAARTITGGTRSRWTVAVECADHPFSCAAAGYQFDG